MDPTRTRELLIGRLVEAAHPVRRLWPPWARLSAWLGLGLVVVGVVALGGLRSDLIARLREPVFLIELATLLAGATLFAVLAFRAAIPGCAPRRWETVLAIGLVAAAAAVSFYRPVHAELSMAQFFHMGLGCAARTFLIALAPWCALVMAIRRGAPLAGAAAGALSGAAAFVLAFGIMRAACPMDELLHLVVWHGVPVLVGVAVSALVGFLWLSRWGARSSSSRSR